MTTSATGIDRAGQRGPDAEPEYRAAIQRDPADPSRNSRLVTFLLAQGRLRSARKAWGEAINRVDPNGERTSVWLAEHFQHRVCQAWLEAGSPSDAYEVLASVADKVIEDWPPLISIRQQVLDAVEAEALAGSVYPTSYPVEERWNPPDVLACALEGMPLKEWFPGRILEAERYVEVFYGMKTRDGYRSMLCRMESAAWASICKMESLQAGDFVYLGVYEGGVRVIVAQPTIY